MQRRKVDKTEVDADRDGLIDSYRKVLPSYTQVHEHLQQMIASEYSEGAQLPSEHQLATQFSVSRNTVRRAIGLLLQEGRVVRIPGRGTFVSKQPRPFTLRGIEGMNQAISDQGARENAFNRVEKMERVSAPEWVAEHLSVPSGELVVRLLRLRLLDGWPLSRDETFIVADIGDRLRRVDLEHQDLFNVLEQRFSYSITKADLKISATAADAYIAMALQVAEHDPVLHLDRLVWSQDRKILCENIAFRADRFVFTATALES